MTIQSFRDREAWQLGMEFVVRVYAVTRGRWPILPVMCGVCFMGCADRWPNGPALDP